MVGDKGKKMKVEEETSAQIDSALELSIEKLQEIQDELEKVNEEASEKVLEVEQKYNAIRKPVYDKRRDIIKSIPDFWLTAFLSHPVLGELLTEEDHKIFKHISSLEVEDFKDLKSGYSITFNFNPNPYFEDTNLTKTFTFLDEEGIKITATQINWKKDMIQGGFVQVIAIAASLCFDLYGTDFGQERPWKVVVVSIDKNEAISMEESRDGVNGIGVGLPLKMHKMGRFFSMFLKAQILYKGFPNGVNHEKKGNKRQFAEESFFTWFADAQQKDDLDEIHDEIAEIIKEDLWPNPLTYFNNEADEEDFDGDGDEEGKDEEDEDDQDEEDEDDN